LIIFNRQQNLSSSRNRKIASHQMSNLLIVNAQGTGLLQFLSRNTLSQNLSLVDLKKGLRQIKNGFTIPIAINPTAGQKIA